MSRPRITDSVSDIGLELREASLFASNDSPPSSIPPLSSPSIPRPDSLYPFPSQTPSDKERDEQPTFIPPTLSEVKLGRFALMLSAPPNPDKSPDLFKTNKDPKDPKTESTIQLDKVIKSLSELFSGMDKNFFLENLGLTKLEILLIKHVLARKLGDSIKAFEKKYGADDSLFFEKVFKELNHFKGKRRKEQLYKFVFSHTLKFLKKKFVDEEFKGAKENEEEVELAFHSFYFKDLTEERELDISCFIDPSRKGVVKNKMFKSLTHDYFKLLFCSQKFEEEFFRFSDNFFIEDYQKRISGKFKVGFEQLRKNIEKNDSGVVFEVVNFCEKLFKNKFYKPPWTISEVRNAKELFAENFGKKR